MSVGVGLRHLLRRLGAALYDGILLVALWFVGTAVVVVPAGGAIPAGSLWFGFYLWCLTGFFYLWFWLHGGQTLGLRAWRLRVIDVRTGQPPVLARGLLRYALAGPIWLSLLGILWSVFDPEQRAVHERLSGTRLAVVPKS